MNGSDRKQVAIQTIVSKLKLAGISLGDKSVAYLHTKPMQYLSAVIRAIDEPNNKAVLEIFAQLEKK